MQANQHHPRISVVIPTHNEARNLYHVLPQIPSMVSEVVLVDGHSTDDTVSLAQQLLPGIRIIKQKGKGKGKVAVKYRDPSNSANTWTGRGRPPARPLARR